MGLLRLILIGLIIVIIFRLLTKKSPPHSSDQQQLVQCEICKAHFPADGRTATADGKHYCPEHRK